MSRERDIKFRKRLKIQCACPFPGSVPVAVYITIISLDPIYTLGPSFQRELNFICSSNLCDRYVDRVKRIWYLSPMQAAKVQASLRIRAVSPEPPLLAHISSESRGTFRQKARSLAPLIGWACAVKICHDGMLEDTNSLDGAHVIQESIIYLSLYICLFY